MSSRRTHRTARLTLLAAAAAVLAASQARAETSGLLGAPGPQPWGDSAAASPQPPGPPSERAWGAPPTGAWGPPPSGPPAPRDHWGEASPPVHAPGGACYARVKFGPEYAPPPSGPEYVWRKLPPPPGAPGPIWCLTVEPFTQPLVQPERYGWVRVLCDTDATPARIAGVQRWLRERGYYDGEVDGRYDDETARAVRRFQDDRGIFHRGYLSYDTLRELDPPPPPPPPRMEGYYGLTTFDTGVIDWPGKVRF